MSKFKVGDRVRSISDDLRGEIGTVVSTDEWDNNDGCDVDFPDNHNYQMYDSELELIKSGEKKMTRRTFKLLKETPTVKKGALYQEACDDGTQQYVLLSNSDLKDESGSPDIYNRSLLEDDTTFFVEVFKVTPEYMTQAELDQWNEFKKVKTPANRKYTKRKRVVSAETRAKMSAAQKARRAKK